MNCFSIRTVKEGGRYRGEYRLSHWSGHKAVMDGDGEPILFAFPSDAHMAATNEFLEHLNSKPAFWRGPSSSDAIEAAERLFTRKADGESEQATKAG